MARLIRRAKCLLGRHETVETYWAPYDGGPLRINLDGPPDYLSCRWCSKETGSSG